MIVQFQVNKNRKPSFTMHIDSLYDVTSDDIDNIRQQLTDNPLPIGTYSYDTQERKILTPEMVRENALNHNQKTRDALRHFWVS